MEVAKLVTQPFYSSPVSDWLSHRLHRRRHAKLEGLASRSCGAIEGTYMAL